MTKLKLNGFTKSDDVDHEPIEFDVPWRSAEDDEEGIETFYARPRVPIGVLFKLETNDPSGMMELIEKALMKKDGAIDEGGRVDESTSSLARWQKLVGDEDRIVPGDIISEVLRGLYVEYTNRRSPSGAQERPTKSDERSSVASLPTGRGSTGRRPAKASTSSASQRTSA